MAWVRIDDQVPHHPKILKAGPEASWLWLCSLAYAQSQLTDGWVPRQAVRMLGWKQEELIRMHKRGASGAHSGRDRGGERGGERGAPKTLAWCVQRLVSVGLWERTSTGYQIHDYLDYNETRQEAIVRKQRLYSARSAAGRIGGLRSAEIRHEAKVKQIASILLEANEAKVKQTAPSKMQAPSHPLSTDQLKGIGNSLSLSDAVGNNGHKPNKLFKPQRSCPHDPHCTARHACFVRQQLEFAKRAD